MIKIKNYIIKILFFFYFAFFSFSSYGQNMDEIFVGDKNAKVEIKIYSSFTCPHCANLHKNTYPKLVNEYVNKNLLKITLVDFPLKKTELNESKIVRCSTKEKSILLIDEIKKKKTITLSEKILKKINEIEKKKKKKIFLRLNK